MFTINKFICVTLCSSVLLSSVEIIFRVRDVSDLILSDFYKKKKITEWKVSIGKINNNCNNNSLVVLEKVVTSCCFRISDYFMLFWNKWLLHVVFGISGYFMLFWNKWFLHVVFGISGYFMLFWNKWLLHVVLGISGYFMLFWE